MFELTQQTLLKIRNTLLRRQKEVEEQIKAIEKDDPVMDTQTAEVAESGTASWQADVHGRVVAIKDDLMELSNKIKYSLARINKGTYGKCENCKKKIEPERLEAMPTATLCLSCSKKPKK